MTDSKRQSVTPIIRIFDENKAKEFYVEFLDFSVDWEQRFEENFPLYMQISYEGCNLHLSEHHGDGSPGVAIRMNVDHIEELHKKLQARNYKYAKPGLEKTAWNTLEITVTDPFSNRIIFYQDVNE